MTLGLYTIAKLIPIRVLKLEIIGQTLERTIAVSYLKRYIKKKELKR
jgi:hypothetical protein